MATEGRGPPKAAGAGGSASLPSDAVPSRSGAAALSATSAAVFQELDGLLQDATDRKQQDYAAKLEQALAKALKGSAHGREQAEALAWCEDLKAPGPKDGVVDYPSLLGELDALAAARSSAGADKSGNGSGAGARLGSFESDLQGLLRRVASESELLARQFPLEDEAQEEEQREPKERPPAEARSRDLNLEAFGGEGEEGEEGPTRLSPKVFQELGPLLDCHGATLEDQHRTSASTLATTMTAFLGGVQRIHQDTHHCVSRILQGEGSDGHPLDQEHAAWRRATLQTLQRGPSSALSMNAMKRAPAKQRRTIAGPGAAGGAGRLSTSSSLPQLRPKAGMGGPIAGHGMRSPGMTAGSGAGFGRPRSGGVPGRLPPPNGRPATGAAF